MNGMSMGATPTPSASRFGMTPSMSELKRWSQVPSDMQSQASSTVAGETSQSMGDFDLPIWRKNLDDRNRPWTDEELDSILPSVGYEVSKFSIICSHSHFFYLFLFSLNRCITWKNTIQKGVFVVFSWLKISMHLITCCLSFV
jgi:hypothetical protein